MFQSTTCTNAGYSFLVFILALVCFAFVFQICRADDALASGGKSPNGRYEVHVYRDDSRDPCNYDYGLIDIQHGKLLKKWDLDGGFVEYEGAINTTKVLWNASSTLFALIDHGTRHSMDLYIYDVSPLGVSAVRIPDYLEKGLSLVGAKECYATSIVTLLVWKENSLTCRFVFDAGSEGYRSPFYDTNFTITVAPSEKHAAQITRMDKPKAEE